MPKSMGVPGWRCFYGTVSLMDISTLEMKNRHCHDCKTDEFCLIRDAGVMRCWGGRVKMRHRCVLTVWAKDWQGLPHPAFGGHKEQTGVPVRRRRFRPGDSGTPRSWRRRRNVGELACAKSGLELSLLPCKWDGNVLLVTRSSQLRSFQPGAKART